MSWPIKVSLRPNPDKELTKEIKIELIRALKAVCEGKMYLEAESARLHLMLALIWEADGNIAGACEIIQVRTVFQTHLFITSDHCGRMSTWRHTALCRRKKKPNIFCNRLGSISDERIMCAL